MKRRWEQGCGGVDEGEAVSRYRGRRDSGVGAGAGTGSSGNTWVLGYRMGGGVVVTGLWGFRFGANPGVMGRGWRAGNGG